MLNYLFLFIAGICVLLLGVSSTRGQRNRFPLLKKLAGKQIYLVTAVILFSVLGYGAYIYKEITSLNLSFVLSNGPGLAQAEKATTNGMDIELQKSASSEIAEAKIYFNAGEHDFLAKNYLNAVDNYQKSINTIPTLSAYLNLVSLRYLSDYGRAEPVLLEALKLARKNDERKFEGLLLLNLGAIRIPQGKDDQADDVLKRSQKILQDVGDKVGQANAMLNIGAHTL